MKKPDTSSDEESEETRGYLPENDTSEVSKTLPVADSIRSDRQSYEDTLKRNIEYDFFIAHSRNIESKKVCK